MAVLPYMLSTGALTELGDARGAEAALSVRNQLLAWIAARTGLSAAFCLMTACPGSLSCYPGFGAPTEQGVGLSCVCKTCRGSLEICLPKLRRASYIATIVNN